MSNATQMTTGRTNKYKYEYGKICHNNDNETQHTIFPGNIFFEATEDVNTYKSIIWYQEI